MPRSQFLRPALAAVCVGCAVSFAMAAGAAVPVQESSSAAGSGGAYGPSGSAPGATGAVDSARLSELFYQLQVLQQEVQELRGLVEEQSYQLNRLARDQQEQYLDLDRRMQAVRANAPPQPSGGAASAVGTAPAAAAASGAATSAAAAAPAAASGGERDAYTAAFNLMKDRQFEASADAFNQLIVNYPNGAYTANAFYWLGELYLAQEEIEKSRQSFMQVINLYPDHQKVPDALYKLGVVYHRLGDVPRAREYLNRVRSEHPQSSAAGLAQTYLAELQ